MACTTHDIANAVKWFRLAADQGEADAQFWLGTMYAQGGGVPQDYVLAHMWFNLSVAHGDEKVVTLRDHTARKMTPDQLAEAQRLAREWKPSSN